MAVEHHGTTVLPFIERDRIVTEDDHLPVVCDLSVVANALPQPTEVSFDAVMVAADQVLVAVQAVEDT